MLKQGPKAAASPSLDVVNLKKRLENKSPEELIEELDQLLDNGVIHDTPTDSLLISTYIDILEEKDPVLGDFDPEQNYADLMERIQQSTYLSPKTVPGKSRFSHLGYYVAAAAAISIFFLGSSYALGADWAKTLFQWGGDLLLLRPVESGQLTLPEAQTEYVSLEDALKQYGLGNLSPGWIPPEYALTSIEVFPMESFVEFAAVYQKTSGDYLSVSILYFLQNAPPEITFEVTPDFREIYTVSDIEHFISSNTETYKACWINGACEGIISGKVSEKELKKIIDSLYERQV